MVGQPDHPRTGRAGLPHQPPHRHPPPDPTRAWSAQVHRPQRSQQRKPGKIIARWPGHMAHLDVKKVGRIPDGGGWPPTTAPATAPTTSPHRRPSHPPPEDQALHATPQRQGRALPEDHDRGTPLRPRIRQRGRTLTSHRHLERPLQLPSTPQRRGRPTASIPTQDPRHQRPALIHLELLDPAPPAGAGPEACGWGHRWGCSVAATATSLAMAATASRMVRSAGTSRPGRTTR